MLTGWRPAHTDLDFTAHLPPLLHAPEAQRQQLGAPTVQAAGDPSRDSPMGLRLGHQPVWGLHAPRCGLRERASGAPLLRSEVNRKARRATCKSAGKSPDSQQRPQTHGRTYRPGPGAKLSEERGRDPRWVGPQVGGTPAAGHSPLQMCASNRKDQILQPWD